jgi:hypothetical protein
LLLEKVIHIMNLKRIEIYIILLIGIGLVSISANPAWCADMKYVKKLKAEGTIIAWEPDKCIISIRASKNLTVTLHLDKDPTYKGLAVSKYSIMPGDRLECEVSETRKSGRMPDTINARVDGKYFCGELLFINKNEGKLITGEGRQVYFSSDTKFYYNGNDSGADKLKPGMRVFLRVDPATCLAGCIEAIDLKAADRHPELVSGSNNIADSKIPEQVREDNTREESQIKITSLSQGSKKKSFKRGDAIDVTLNATAGADAVFDVCGIARGVKFKETKPGCYKGKYVVDRGDARYSYVIVRLKNKNGKTTRICPGSIDLAVTPPEIPPVPPPPGK